MLTGHKLKSVQAKLTYPALGKTRQDGVIVCYSC